MAKKKSERLSVTMTAELYNALMDYAGPENGAAAFITRQAIREFLLNKGVQIGTQIHPATRGGKREGAGRPQKTEEEKNESNTKHGSV